MGPKIIFLVLLFLVKKGDSLRCYTCFAEKDQNSACEDLSLDRDKVKTEDCSAGEVCAIYTTETPGLGHSMVKRSCGSKEICEKIHSMESNKVVDCKTCTTDLCDSGNFFGGSVVVLFSSLLIAMMF